MFFTQCYISTKWWSKNLKAGGLNSESELKYFANWEYGPEPTGGREIFEWELTGIWL